MINSTKHVMVSFDLFQTNTLIQNTQVKSQQQRPTLPNIFANSLPKSSPLRGLPLKLGMKNNISLLGQNGSSANLEDANDNVDMSSPYSPGSSLSDGLFDPPSPANNFNASPNLALSTKIKKHQEKKDAFEALFDASPIVHKSSKSRSKIPPKKKKGNNEFYIWK